MSKRTSSVRPNLSVRLTAEVADYVFTARNVLFLTLLAARGSALGPRLCWNLYYHLYLDDDSIQALHEHLLKLLQVSVSSTAWEESEFGAQFRFSTVSTLSATRSVWEAYAEAIAHRGDDEYQAKFEAARIRSKQYKQGASGSAILTSWGARAAAPFGSEAILDDEFRSALDSWWETGLTGGAATSKANVPNPLFSAALSENRVLAFGSDPILGYHLAAAKAHLAELSPFRPTKSDVGHGFGPGLVEMAKFQFSEWIKAFLDIPRHNLVMRFVAADCFAFCHTLQYQLATGKSSNNFYRRQLSAERLELDVQEYGKASTPKAFDVIDTSNLSDYLGTLNILISASPLLKDTPAATLYTELMQKTADNERKKFEELLCGPTTTVSTLLGMSPAEYWTNATVVASDYDYVHSIAESKSSTQRSGVYWRFAWKFNRHLSGQMSTQRLKVNPSELAGLIHKTYQSMFIVENPLSLLSLSKDEQLNAASKQAYPQYHRGSLVAFIKRLLQLVDVDAEVVCKSVLEKVTSDSAQIFGSNFMQALHLELSQQGLYTEAWLRDEIRPLSGWTEPPLYSAITFSVPAPRWKSFYRIAAETNASFTVEGSLKGMRDSVPVWHNLFAGVQVAFGKIETTGVRGSPEFSVKVIEDKRQWLGDSSMVASFYVPTAALQVDPINTKVGLGLHNNPQTLAVFKSEYQFGQSITIFEADLNDHGHVFVTQNQPGQDGCPVFNSHHMEPSSEPDNNESRISMVTNINASGEISSITGHLDLVSGASKKLLSEKSAVNIQQISPLLLEIALGSRSVVYTLKFPAPVTQEGSKTRIARTSSYVEIIAPLANPATSQTLDSFVFPSTMATVAQSSNIGRPIPVPLHIPHLNLDTLPILDVSDKESVGFLTNLCSWTFSVRERNLRDQADTSGMASSSRMNLKESLFTMFMLSSGLQGGQTGLFAINHPQKGGIHMLIFVSALRLDSTNGSVVLDAAALPFTRDIITGGELSSLLLILRTLEICSITVNDEELELWKKTLPALSERCRNWSHTEQCEYAQPGATVPLSIEPAKQVICSCGAGKLPQNFINLPEWETAAKFSTRVAISPIFAVPFVEDVISPDLAKMLVGGAGTDTRGGTPLRCRSCGKTEAKAGGALKKCMRCLKVRYCSVECQKRDWKKHRMECGEAEEHQK